MQQKTTCAVIFAGKSPAVPPTAITAGMMDVFKNGLNLPNKGKKEKKKVSLTECVFCVCVCGVWSVKECGFEGVKKGSDEV